jgi:hypothetical protein
MMKKQLLTSLLALLPLIALPQITSHLRISNGLNGFPSLPEGSSALAYDLENIGDFNGDGTDDLLVVDNGTPGAGEDNTTGSLWILMLNPDGTVNETIHLKDELIGALPDFFAGFSGTLDMQATSIGDLNGDQVPDLAVLLPYYPQANGNRYGAVLIAFLNAEAQITSHYLLLPNSTPDQQVRFFYRGLANVGDINGDGYDDLMVGSQKVISPGSPPLNDNQVRLYFLHPEAEEVSYRGYQSTDFYDLDDDGFFGFGYEICGLGDLNGDGWGDIAVGLPHYDIFNPEGFFIVGGNITIFFLDGSGNVLDHQNINAAEGGFAGELEQDDPHFGESIVPLGDLDGDGGFYLAVGASWDNMQGPIHLGAAWILKLSPAGQVIDQYVLSPAAGNIPFSLADHDHLFETMTVLNDIDNDGRQELVAGSTLIDGEGAVFIFEGNFGGLMTNVAAPPEPEQSVQVLPNPSLGQFRVLAEDPITEVRVYDAAGRQLPLSQQAPARELTLDLSRFPAGHYRGYCQLATGVRIRLSLMRMD